MSGKRWRAGVGTVAAVLCVALAGCGPADTGAAGLQSVAGTGVPSSRASTDSAPATTSKPTAPRPAAAATNKTTASAPASSTSAKTSAPAPKPTRKTTATPAPAKPAKATVTLTASAGDGQVRYGDQSAFIVTVRSATAGSDLSGHVAVLDGTAVVAEGDADATGSVQLGFLNTADPGSKTYKVTYSGNPEVTGSAIELPVRTTQTNVDIAIDWPEDATPGKDVTISADVIGTPQTPSGRATITVDGAPVADAAIADDGTISGTAKAVPAGDHAVEVRYAGDVRFEANTATATLTLKPPPVNPNQAGAAAAQASNPCPAAASACVDLSGEQAWLQSAGKITYGPVPITSGREGHRTGTGMFEVFWLDKDHRSSIFNDAPMPNSVFFDNGIAFHEGSLSDQSHGCIHLSWDASETFYDTLSVGDNVYVWGAPPY